MTEHTDQAILQYNDRDWAKITERSPIDYVPVVGKWEWKVRNVGKISLDGTFSQHIFNKCNYLCCKTCISHFKTNSKVSWLTMRVVTFARVTVVISKVRNWLYEWEREKEKEIGREIQIENFFLQPLIPCMYLGQRNENCNSSELDVVCGNVCFMRRKILFNVRCWRFKFLSKNKKSRT